MRECGQSAVGASRGAEEGDRGAASPRCRPRAADPPTVDGKRSPSFTWRDSRFSGGLVGQPGPAPHGIHRRLAAAGGPHAGLAHPGIYGRSFTADGNPVRPRALPSGDTRRSHAGAKRRPLSKQQDGTSADFRVGQGPRGCASSSLANAVNWRRARRAQLA